MSGAAFHCVAGFGILSLAFASFLSLAPAPPPSSLDSEAVLVGRALSPSGNLPLSRGVVYETHRHALGLDAAGLQFRADITPSFRLSAPPPPSTTPPPEPQLPRPVPLYVDDHCVPHPPFKCPSGPPQRPPPLRAWSVGPPVPRDREVGVAEDYWILEGAAWRVRVHVWLG